MSCMGVAHLAVFAGTQLTLSAAYAQGSDQGVQNTQQTQKKPEFSLPQGLSGSSGGTGSDSGKQASGVQMVSMGASVAMAGYLMTQCGPKNPMACAMAAMAASQATSLLGSSKGSKAAGAGMSTWDPSLGQWTNNPNFDADGSSKINGWQPSTPDNPTARDPNNPTATTASNPVEQRALDQINGMKSQLEKLGYKISKDGTSVKMPDGREISGAAMASPSAMAAAGMSASEISSAQAALKAAQDKAAAKFKTASLGADAGGGGGGSGGVGGRDPAADGGSGMGQMFGKFPWDKEKDKKDKNRLSGMSKKLGNDNIGVAGDDIFEMVTRRYKARDAANDFLK